MIQIGNEYVETGITKPADKGKNMYSSGKISLVETSESENNIILFRAHVKRSFQRQYCYPKVAIDFIHGDVIISECNCEASETGSMSRVVNFMLYKK